MKKEFVQVQLTKKQLNNLKKGKGVRISSDDLEQEFKTPEIKPFIPVMPEKPFTTMPVTKPKPKLEGSVKRKVGMGSYEMTFRKGHPNVDKLSGIGLKPPGY